MRELLLLRHTKSSWDVPDLDDHDRDLAPRGIKAAGRIGRYIRKNDLHPDLILCSTAIRALRTLELVQAEWKAQSEISRLKGLYLGSPSQILAIVQRQTSHHHRILLIGHNPGIATLASQLFSLAEPMAAEAMAMKYPTGGLAHLRFPVESWREISLGQGELIRFVQPRLLES